MFEDIKINKKILLLALLVSALFIAAGAGALYGARRLILRIPSFAQNKLASQGISLTFKDQGHSRVGTSVDIYDVMITGAQLPYEIKLKGLGIDFKLGYSPLLRIHTRINNPTVKKNPSYVPREPSKQNAPETSSSLFTLAGLALKLTYISTEVVDASFPEYGIADLSASGMLNSVKFSKYGLQSIDISHEINLGSVTTVPWFPGLCWMGNTIYSDNKLELKNHKLGLGLFATQLNANYDLETQKWNAEVTIPDGPIKNKEQIASAYNAFWLTSASGEIGLKATFQGIGLDPAGIQGEGIAHAKDLVLGMNHNFVRGNVKSNFDVTFNKNTSLEFAAKIATDFTDALVVNKDEFRKTKDIPLTFFLDLEGKDGNVSLRGAELVFNNLKSTFSGLWSYQPQKTADIKFEVSPVNLNGWERFFPRYPSMIAHGSLALSGSYLGPTEDWKAATINLKINAQKVKFPILRMWNTNKDLKFEGVTTLESDTSLSLVGGTLKNLSTNSFIDLKETKIKYKELFNKEEGTPLDFDLTINSTKNLAEIKKGYFHLGKLGASAKGKITNFESPVVNMTLQSDLLEVSDLLSFVPPSYKIGNLAGAKGSLSLKAKVAGALLSKSGPDYSADIDTRNLSFNYLLEEKKKNIEVLNASGLIIVTPDTLQTKKLFVQTPGSEGYIDMFVRGFTEPNIQFSFQGRKFDLKDFYEQEKPKPIEAAAAAATASDTNDFRKNPYLQKMQLVGEATVQSANLGYTQAENLSIKLKYDRLKLSIHPLSFNAFDGKIVSETDWDGTKEIPTTSQKLSVTSVDANRFLTSYSEKAKNVVLGKLSTNFDLNFSGMKSEEIQKSLKGSGEFALTDGTFKTIRFTKDPMQKLKQVPIIGAQITKTEWDERFNDIKGTFSLQEGKLLISNIVLSCPFFDGVSKDATVGFDQSLQAAVTIYPKDSMLPPYLADIIRDESGRPSLPITLTGQVQSPSVGMDTNILIPRTKNYLARQADKEKERAISEVKTKATEEVQKALKGKVGNFFK